MANLRETIAGQAQIGAVKFWATRTNPSPTPRRIVKYTGIGITGAVTEDLGRDARVEILNATVKKTVYLDLDGIKNAAKVVTCEHPLFGIFEGRLVDVTCDAGPSDMVDIICTLIEHGNPTDFFVIQADTTAAKKQSTKAAFDNLSLNALNAYPTSSGLPSAGAGMASGYASFSAVTDAVDSGDGLWSDVSAVFDELAETGNALIETIDSFTDATQEMIDMVDTTYELIATAREYVDAMEKQAGDVWQLLQVTTPLSLAEIALELAGDDSEETISLILGRNPTLIDICAVPIGVELSIPVSL